MRFKGYFALLFLFVACRQQVNIPTENKNLSANFKTKISVTDTLISGCYEGPEFVSYEVMNQLNLKGTDIAHQFSNRMVDTIGKILKIRYLDKYFSKIDLENISMSTEGMNNSGDVKFCLKFPIIHVNENEAKTGFEHCGGWNHDVGDNLEIRLQKLRLISKEKSMEVSSKKSTPEGLIEYWIQFKHK